MWATDHRQSGARRQNGAIGILFAGSLFILFGFFALALDLSQLYNRKMELQTTADTAALAAAVELDGTKAGIERALGQAAALFADADKPMTYRYGSRSMAWSDAAITFGKTTAGPWQPAGDAKGDAAGLLFTKVDTAGLSPAYGQLRTMFLAVLDRTRIIAAHATAIAGRSAIKVTPLGICAMRSTPYRDHKGELEEYGFRRGVGYNLLDLNAASRTAGAAFIVNPYPGPPLTDAATLAPFVCTGTIAMSRLAGGMVTVSSNFPMNTLYNQFNSRFGLYLGASNACDARTAPSDTNLKEYKYNGGASWMGGTLQQQSSKLYQEENMRATITWPDDTPAGTTGVQFGPLWSYAKAVPFSQYNAGLPEPVGGYATFEVGAWNQLYGPDTPTLSTTNAYPATPATPYSTTTGIYFGPAGGNKAVANRRVLNLPLLACPVSENKAYVRAIGKFLMTVPATGSALYGEFGGLVSEQTLGTQVMLYP